TDIGGTSGGYISSDGGATLSARGVCWGTATAPVLGTGNFTTNGTGMGSFTSIITGLTAGTLYYVRAYATNSAGTTYGPEINFTPVTPGFPTVNSTVVSAIGETTATTGGNVTDNGGGTIIERGVCYGTTSTPTIANSTVVDPNPGTGAFTSIITGLTTGQLYYVRAYATNGAGTSYGAIYSFTPFTFATVTTDAITNIAATSATSGGNVTSDNGSAVTARGVCYGTTSSPTIANFVVADVPGTGTGTFVSNLTGLTLGLTYYVRAYATNAAGTAYGNEEIFVPAGPTTPTVTTDQPTNGTETTVTSGGEVTNDGGSTVTARGVVWSATSFPPTLADPHTTDGTGTGTFTSSITGLTAGNYYTIIAYATNSSGTAYGNEVYYAPVGPPTLGPGVLTYFAGNTDAQIGLNIINNGGSEITAYGAVWSTLPDPTVEVNEGITIETAPLMPPTAAFSGLSLSTTYYVKAYATNSYGPSYSPQAIFTTQDNTLPSLSTNPNIDKVGAIAYGGGEVFDIGTGGTVITNAGLVWGTSANPTVASNLGMTTDGYYGSFGSMITGLTIGTTYHVRAYASNDNGVNYSYGADVYFVATAATVGQQISLSSGATYAVFSTDGTGLHGLIAIPYSYGLATDWGCSPSTVGTSTAVGAGEANTAAIIADITGVPGCESAIGPGNFAAEMAASSFGPGWYLPSKEELDLMWTNRVAAQIDFSWGATTNIFWSSSEASATNAWHIDGTTGAWVSVPKSDQLDYFVIRSF
ncbi:MAG: beta strand repeat-containing protein, partial [Bacteroidales bacterium]